jgi:hypothetical protein
MYEMESCGGDAVRGTVVCTLSLPSAQRLLPPAWSAAALTAMDSKAGRTHLTPCALWPSCFTLMSEGSDKDGHVMKFLECKYKRPACATVEEGVNGEI